MDFIKKSSIRKLFYIFVPIALINFFLMIDNQYLWGIINCDENCQETRLDIPKNLLNIISVDIHDIPLDEALEIIAQKGDFELNYNRSRLPIHRKVTIKMSHVPALKVLLKVLEVTDTELKINENRDIIITPLREKNNPQGNIYGKVVEYGNKNIIPGVVIQILGTKFSTISNKKGEYRFSDVPVGTYTLRFSMPGFKTLDKTDVFVRSKRITHVNVDMEIPVLDIQETVEVIGSHFQTDEKNPVSAVSISSEEVRRAPGTGGGLPRMLKALPGVVTVSDEDTDLVVRGGSPNEVGYLIDNIEVPTISHMPNLASSGGSYSALNADLIKNVSFYTGAFSANYGGYLSAVTDITWREGNREEFDGQLNVDMAGSGFIFEGPLGKGKGAWLATFRKSYLKLLKDIGLLDVGGIIGSIDGHFKVNYDVSSTQKLSLLYYHLSGSYVNDLSGRRVQDGQKYAHHTLGLNWTSYWDQKFFSNTSLAFSSVNDTIGEDFGTLNFRDDVSVWKNDRIEIWDVKDEARTFSLRNSNYLVINKHNKLEFGLQIKSQAEKLKEIIYPIYESEKFYDILSPMWDDEGKWNQPQQNSYSFNSTQYGLFFSYIGTHIKRLTTTIGFRGDYATASGRFNPAPRFSLRYKINKRLAIGGGYGIFYQRLPLTFLAYIPGASSLKDMKATHYTLGMEWLLGNGAKLTLEAYIKNYENLPISPDEQQALAIDHAVSRYVSNFWTPVGYRVPKTLVDGGSGYSRGIELFIQKKLTEKFYGFLSISYFRSRYKDLSGEIHDRVYDNQYSLSLNCGYKPFQSWEFSTKWTVFGGGPYTPIDVQASTQRDRWILNNSKFLKSRYPAYSSLNLRVDKRFYFKASSLIVFLDVWNVLNRKNVLYYWYTRWWENSPIGETYQMGILPIFGVEFEF